MLLLAVIWIALLLSALIFGARMLFPTAPRESGPNGDRAFVAIWLGLLGIANVLLLAALAGPLTPFVAVLVFAGATGVGIAHGKTRAHLRALAASISFRCTIAVCFIALAAAFEASLPVYLYDTGLYHYPLMMWLARYGDVPGLALLHIRFAMVTSWLTIPASLDHGVLAGRTSSLLNGFAFATMAIHVFFCVDRWRLHADCDADRFMACAGGGVIAYALATGFVNSASPDVPGLYVPTVMVWVALRSRPAPVPAGCMLLAFFLFTVKLSALPAVAAAALFVAWRSPAAGLAKWGLAAIVIVAPMALTSVVVSGCVLFPISSTCLDLPWSLSPESTATYARIITEWARWAGPTPAHADLTTWWAHWSARKSNLALLVLMVVSVGAALGLQARIGKDPQVAFVAALAILGIGYVAILAPDLRFAAGYLLLLPALYLAERSERTARLRPYGGLAAAAVGLAVGAAFVINALNATRTIPGNATAGLSLVSSLVVPAKFQWLREIATSADGPDARFVTEESNSNFTYRRPVDGDQCWDIPPPCSPSRLSADIGLGRTQQGLAGGFVRR